MRIVWNRGSSPRVRGKPTPEGHYGAPGGLIPARAGKTRSRLPVRLLVAAHPRACGENDLVGADSQTEWGSSPRVRGKPATARGALSRSGLIPARAGKTRDGRARRRKASAHPRACGENWMHDSIEDAKSGSSPRVRGKQVRTFAPTRTARLIPARAGKTGALDGLARQHGAHPRACGENWEPTGTAPAADGSSPRVRGKPRLGSGGATHDGLIPARAGKTFLSEGAVIEGGAHPRACGENMGLA